MKKYLPIWASIAIITLSGCKTKEPVVEVEPIDQPDVYAEPDWDMVDADDTPKRARYAPAEKRVNDLLHTKLAVAFDWERHRLDGEATLTFKPYFYKTDSLTLDAKGMDIHRVALLKNKKYSDLKYTYDTLFLRIDLDKTYDRDEEYQVYIEYTAKPDEFEMGGSSCEGW